MAPRPSEGAVLLVAGHTLPRGAAHAATAETLGQIGEVLLSSAPAWRIRRLSPGVGERYAPNRASLKFHVDELCRRPARVAMLIVSGTLVEHAGEPALVTDAHYLHYPDDATLPLSWIRARVAASAAESVFVLVAGRPAIDAVEPARWFGSLATERDSHVIALDVSTANGETLDALLAGLRGGALDTATGTITLRSLSDHLARRAPALRLQRSDATTTLTSPPPLTGLWNARGAPTADAAAPLGADDDLLGVVLPGRFRVDATIARGSFGTIYRARQLAVDRDVAVKVLQPGIHAASEDGRLFVHEIQSIGRIDHANVVRIHQADVTPDGRLFFAMELLVGRDLQAIIDREAPVDRDRAVRLAQQLLAGLGAAHDAGIVHADVKPANAFVVDGGDQERVVLVDFGLARLKAAGRPAASAGGTPAYMAPEQLRDQRVDARSDLFSAALVLVSLLTGWRRRRADQLVPPLDGIDDDALRGVLARALAVDPADRYATAAELSEALAGNPVPPSVVIEPAPPFRHLAPLTERDGNRLHGRARDVATLMEHVLYRRSVVYTAPSGTGKTSLLRAGLVPRLESVGFAAIYVACRASDAGAIAAAIWPGATSVLDAIVARHRHRGGRLVLIVDQIEAQLSDPDGAHGELDEVVAFDRWPAEIDVSVILSVREDFLARLLAVGDLLHGGTPVVRLAPLRLDGARDAIVGPLVENRLGIEPELLELLLRDLEQASRPIGGEMGWDAGAAVYPPHLQLACSVLFEALAPNEATITLAHYRRLGGLATIVGEHLDRVIETELDDAAATIARDLFLALVTSSHTRTSRTEDELLAIVGHRHGRERVRSVLEVLRARGLLVRLRSRGGDTIWELVHDSMVPRALSWVDRRDLDRRRAAELLRYHLRRSRGDVPSLLARADLRELREHDDVIAELDAEWASRVGEPWTPRRLVEASRAAIRRRVAIGASSAVALVAIAGLAVARWQSARAAAAEERSLRDRDLGRFVLELEAFDWDVDAQRARPPAHTPRLEWRLHDPDPADPASPGAPVPPGLFERRGAHVEARGGPAFLVVERRDADGGDCPPSIVFLREVPGYASRSQAAPVFRVRVPTCQATQAGTVLVPAGPFTHGGSGEPPSAYLAASTDSERAEVTLDVPELRIDRTEITNAAFAVFAELAEVTGIAMPVYPQSTPLADADGERRPVAGITWTEARHYCRFLGKDLPTSTEWEKAMRGGLVLADGSPNPAPRRNLPWGTRASGAEANVGDTGGHHPVDVGSWPGDRSPYDVLDLAGNVQEWTASTVSADDPGAHSFRITRGGNWDDTTAATLVDYMAIENPRPIETRSFAIGARCVLRSPPRGSPRR